MFRLGFNGEIPCQSSSKTASAIVGTWKNLYNLKFWSLYNPGHNILELYKVLIQIQFIKNKKEQRKWSFLFIKLLHCSLKPTTGIKVPSQILLWKCSEW